MRGTKPRSQRPARDFYPTPREAFDRMLPHLHPGPVYWDPAAGDWRLVYWLKRASFEARGSDIEPQPDPKFAQGCDVLAVDFLATEGPIRGAVITNPPFSLAREFVERAVQAPHAYLLLPLTFLAGQKRLDFWRRHVPQALFVLSARPSFTNDGRTAAVDYAWFYWGSAHRGIFHL